MAEKVEVELDLARNSHWRVALDLAKHVAVHETENKKKDRSYWFDLYHQCHKVVYKGQDAKTVVKNQE